MVDSGPVPPMRPSVFIKKTLDRIYNIFHDRQDSYPAKSCQSCLHLLLSCRALRGFADVVFRFGDPHDPLIKPSDDVLQPLDAVPWLPGARQFVRLIREAHHHRRYLPVLQCPEHRLTTRPGRRSPIYLTEDQHQWGLDLVDVSDRRAPAIIFRIFERRRLEPRRLEESEVSRVPPVRPACDVAL